MLAKLVRMMCSTPRMFARNGRFEEVVAWLQGFEAGLHNTDRGFLSVWDGFMDWLPKRLRYPDANVWGYEFRKRYPDDEIALAEFRNLFAEYQGSEVAGTSPNLIERICINPQSFTYSGTFEETEAWLMGFACGLTYVTPEITSEWSGFVRWLPKRLQYQAGDDWADELLTRHAGTNDAVALEELHNLFEEYRGGAGVHGV